MSEVRIGTMPGDFIGPEVMAATIPVIDEICRQAGVNLDYTHILAAGEAYDQTQTHLPDSSIETAREMDAILKGPFGGPPNSVEAKWKNLEINAVLALRKELGVFANLRPVNSKLSRICVELSPLKPEFIEGVDMMFVRDLSGDVYFGERGEGIDAEGQAYAYETGYYTGPQVLRVMKAGVQQAMERRKHLTLVHKTNVLDKTGKLWKYVFDEVSIPETSLLTDYMNVDAMAAALISNPARFDTIVLPNMFGDILTDEASELIGSIGLGCSASIGEGKFGLYEPIHGSSPNIAGTGAANPVGMILSGAMLLRHSLDMDEEAAAVERAVGKTMDDGYVTHDLFIKASPRKREELGLQEVSTQEFSDKVVDELQS